LESSAKDSTNVEEAFVAMITDIERLVDVSRLTVATPSVNNDSHRESIKGADKMNPDS
jgi:hypothetical protein